MSRHVIDPAYYEIDREWDDRMDLLPVWSDDWEKRDPLRGKRGWTHNHYVNTAIAVGIAAAGLSLFALPIASARNVDDRARQINLERVQQESAFFPPRIALPNQPNDGGQGDADHD